MVFDYVAVRVEKDECGKTTNEEIMVEGKICAKSKESAMIKIGAVLGDDFTDEVEVFVRPF